MSISIAGENGEIVSTALVLADTRLRLPLDPVVPVGQLILGLPLFHSPLPPHRQSMTLQPPEDISQLDHVTQPLNRFPLVPVLKSHLSLTLLNSLQLGQKPYGPSRLKPDSPIRPRQLRIVWNTHLSPIPARASVGYYELVMVGYLIIHLFTMFDSSIVHEPNTSDEKHKNSFKIPLHISGHLSRFLEPKLLSPVGGPGLGRYYI